MAAQRLNRITRSAMIAGGYPRDAVLGGRVKDIDIFVDSSRYPTDERRDALCDRIYEAFGQTWQRTSMDSVQAQETYGADPETGETFETYNSLSTEGEWNRVNVIFSRQNQKLNQFDWSICRFYVDPESINPIYNMRSQDRDLRNILFTGGIADLRNTTGIIEHANRIKAKYEDARFMFDPNSFANLGMLYSQMIQGGLIGSQAREVLPTQTEMPTGDSVGLNSRARFGQGSRGSTIRETAAQWAERQRHTQRWHDAAQGQIVRVTDFDELLAPPEDPWGSINVVHPRNHGTPEEAGRAAEAEATRAAIERMQERARRVFEANFRNLTNGRPSF